MNRKLLFIFGLLGVLTGCKAFESHFHHDVMEHLRGATHQPQPLEVSSGPYLGDAKYVEVKGTGSRAAFNVVQRTPELKRQNCQECHDKPLDQLLKETAGKTRTHWEIQLEHADVQTMSCLTCHHEKQMSQLRSTNGVPVELDHSYQVCAGCHFKQAQDWAGGAHGKRVGGWAPPRVIYNCAGCHNPHHPQLEKRWPVRTSRLPTPSR